MSVIQQLDLLQQVVNYIEDHIKEEMSAEELANIAGYSPFHFSRIFQKYTGYSVMDYVVKRKLQFALYELANGKKILPLALEYGFETHSGFTKAFKKCFGSPPSLYKLHCPTSLPQKLDLISLHQKHTGGIVMQPKIIKRGCITVAGKIFESYIGNISFTRDAPAYWEQEGLTDGFTERFLYQLLSPEIHGEYCINLYCSEEQFDYLFAVNYDEGKVLPDGLTLFQIPATTYAVFRTPLVEVEQFALAIRGTWRYILEDWFPASSYEVDESSFDFEYYDEHCHYWEHEKIYMEIHIPIKERE